MTMADPPLTELIYAALDAGQGRLPVHSAVTARAEALLQAERPTAAGLATLIGNDPVLACNLFRAANSAFYQGLPKIVTIDAAMTRIGLDQSAELIRRTCRDGQNAGRGRLLSRYLPPLWQHSFGSALGARWLAERCGYRSLAEQAHLAGLLHDIGKWLLLASFEQLADSDGGIVLADQLIAAVLENLHVEVGLQLIVDWHLPDEFARVIGGHHQAGLDGQDLVVTLVRLANLGCHKVGLGWKSDPDLVLPTTAEAQFLGIDEITLAEYEIMLEDRFQLVPAGAGSGSPAFQGGCR
jgi:HD-like signal output (HDOD) protein